MRGMKELLRMCGLKLFVLQYCLRLIVGQNVENHRARLRTKYLCNPFNSVKFRFDNLEKRTAPQESLAQ